MDESFTPLVDDDGFVSSDYFLQSSPDNERLAMVYSTVGGEWLIVGSFESGLRRIPISLPPTAEYRPYSWISNSEVLYAHSDGLFAVVDVDSGEQEVFGEQYGQMKVLGETNGVLLGVVDRVQKSPRFELVGCIRETGAVKVIDELESDALYFDLGAVLSDESVFIEDYQPNAESLADQGIRKYTIAVSGNEIQSDTEFHPVWDEASSRPRGIVNGWLIIQRGGLGSEREFARADETETELLLYDWETGECKNPELDGIRQAVLTDEWVLDVIGIKDEGSDMFDEYVGVISQVTDDGELVEVERREVMVGGGFELVDGSLYAYSYEEEQCVSIKYDATVLGLSALQIEAEAEVIDEIALDFADDYQSKVYASPGADVDSEHPVIVCAYPSPMELDIRDVYGLELLERGYILVGTSYADGEFYGKTLALAELIERLHEKDYCGSVGLYGFSAGGTQVLNFAASTYSDAVEGVFAGCPNVQLGTLNGFDGYLSPVEYEDEQPLLFKEYSPLSRADQISLPTFVLTGSVDNRIFPSKLDEFKEKVGDSFTFREYERGHSAFTYEQKVKMMRDIVQFFERVMD